MLVGLDCMKSGEQIDVVVAVVVVFKALTARLMLCECCPVLCGGVSSVIPIYALHYAEEIIPRPLTLALLIVIFDMGWTDSLKQML